MNQEVFYKDHLIKAVRHGRGKWNVSIKTATGSVLLYSGRRSITAAIGRGKEWVDARVAWYRKREQIPDVLFCGHEVYSALSLHALTRTSIENVSDVLDAVVRIMRRNHAEG